MTTGAAYARSSAIGVHITRRHASRPAPGGNARGRPGPGRLAAFPVWCSKASAPICWRCTCALHSRYEAVVWSRHKDQLSWLGCHTEAFKRVGGVAATLRVDNEKTAISRGAGLGHDQHQLPTLRGDDALSCGCCAPRQPQAKAKWNGGCVTNAGLPIQADPAGGFGRVAALER